MHANRIAFVLLVVSASRSPAPSWADYSIRAGFSYYGASRAFPDLNKIDQDARTSVKPNAGPYSVVTDGKPLVTAAEGIWGRAQAVGNTKATARFGKLSVSVDAELEANNFQLGPVYIANHAFAEASLRATAAWRDTTMLYSPLYPVGTLFTGTTLAEFHGGFSSEVSVESFSGTANAILDVSLRTSTGFLAASGTSLQSEPGADPREGTTPPPSVVETPFAYINGLPMEFGFTLELFGKGSASRGYWPPHEFKTGASKSKFSGNFSRTLTWGGIKSVVVAATGEPVENWTITSESGFDYSKPFVPEPTCAMLLSSALCTWLGWARSRRQRS